MTWHWHFHWKHCKDIAVPILDLKQFTLGKYIPAKLSEPTLEILYAKDESHVNNNPASNLHEQQKCKQLTFPFAATTLGSASIKMAKTLVHENKDLCVKKVVELTLDTTTCFGSLDYQPGDTIAILPSNSKNIVDELLQRLDLTDSADLACYLKVSPSCTKKSAKVPTYIPPTTTPRKVLTDCLDLHAVPKKQMLSSLANCTTAKEERDFLNCLSSKEATAYYNELILSKGLKLIDLLKICATCKPTLPLLIEHLPRLLPRPYSIANSPHSAANELRIIYSVLPVKPGVTSNMLEQLVAPKVVSTTPMVLIYLREPSKFRYTADEANANHILIGVGTALAPFFGFLQYKQHTSASGETWLYAGAKAECTILKRQYLLELQTQGVLNRYRQCCSRTEETDFKYVQELLIADAKEFVQFLLQAQTILYICADGAKISKSIEAGIVTCLKQELDIADTEALEMLKDFRATGKYREDLWL